MFGQNGFQKSAKLAEKRSGPYKWISGMTMGRVGDNLRTIVATNLVDYDCDLSWKQSEHYCQNGM